MLCPIFTTSCNNNHILCTKSTLCDLTELLKIRPDDDYEIELNSAVKNLVEQVDIFQQTCIKELKNHTDQLQ